MKILVVLGTVIWLSCQVEPEKRQEIPIVTVAEEEPIFLSNQCEKIKELSELKRCSESKFLQDLFKNAKYVGNPDRINHPTKMIVEFVISEKGLVESVKILQKIEPELDNSVIDFLKTTKWKPARRNGKEVTFEKKIPIHFEFR